MEIATAVIALTDSVRAQTELVTAFSAGGIGLGLLALSRMREASLDEEGPCFRKPYLPVLSLLLFLTACALGYVIGAYLTGYFAEITKEFNFSNNERIFHAQNHFNQDYFALLQLLGFVQLATGAVAVILIGSWYLTNYWPLKTRCSGKDKL